MKYSSSKPGFSPSKRQQRFATLLRGTDVATTVGDAMDIWGVTRNKAARYLSAYARRGLLMRISQGVYIPVPLTSMTAEVMPEDPFAIAQKLYSPCYIGGWSAAEYWDMTEQIFQSVVVITQKLQRNYQPNIAGIDYLIHVVKPNRFFGLTTVWENNVKIQISDPTRTIIDMILNPSMGGGIGCTVEILTQYMISKEKSIEKLVEYLGLLNMGSAYKRMGFLIEKYFPNEKILIEICKKSLSAGYSKLDTQLECPDLVTKWRLWVPKGWK